MGNFSDREYEKITRLERRRDVRRKIVAMGALAGAIIIKEFPVLAAVGAGGMLYFDLLELKTERLIEQEIKRRL